jgi:hypothetical protein
MTILINARLPALAPQARLRGMAHAIGTCMGFAATSAQAVAAATR